MGAPFCELHIDGRGMYNPIGGFHCRQLHHIRRRTRIFKMLCFKNERYNLGSISSRFFRENEPARGGKTEHERTAEIEPRYNQAFIYIFSSSSDSESLAGLFMT